MINTNNELIMSFGLGLLAAIALLYWYFAGKKKKKPEKNISQKVSYGINIITKATSPVKFGKIAFRKNLDVSKTELDLKDVLALIERYQKERTPELLKITHQHLQTHNKEGNNIAHEYLTQENVNPEVLETMLEIEPQLLWEENTKGESLLHVAVEHHHYEVVERLMEEKHFHTPEAREHFLSHQDHHGKAALHHIVEESWIHLHGEAYQEAFLHMIQKHPVGALFWQDNEGKTVYEHYFSHNEADGKKLVETLLHKGVLVHQDNHFEIASEEVRKRIYEALTENKEAELNKFLHLCLYYYPTVLHHEIAETSEKPIDFPENIIRRKNILKNRPE